MSIAELGGVKLLVQQDPGQYPTVVDTLLAVADSTDIGIRRWCALFFMDAITSLELADSVKTDIAIKVLPKLESMVRSTDSQVQKISISCVAHAYPSIFSYVCRNAQQHIWTHVENVKRECSLLWDSTNHIGVQASCIKLAQVVVQTQSKLPPGSTLDEPNLQNVPQNHILLDPVMLVAEAQGLLDRILGYFAENSIQPALLSASVNAALTLVNSRPQMGQKIINSICSMNLSQKQGLGSSVAVRFVEKTLTLDLHDVARSLPAYRGIIGNFLPKVAEYCASVNLRKRAATQENEDSSKRVKLAQNDWPTNTTTEIPEGTHHLSELFKLVDANNVLAQFNARDLPTDIAVRIALSGIKNANTTLLNNCISIINKRSQGIEIVKQTEQQDQETEQPSQKQDQPQHAATSSETAAVASENQPDEDTVLTITLPETDETRKRTTDLINRVVRAAAQAPAGSDDSHLGLTRNIRWSKDSWVYLISRIATRAVPDDSPVADRVREYLYKYAMTDFRKHLDMIVIWLSEEWFAENVLSDPKPDDKSFYFETLAHIVDQMIPRMEVSDSKMFIRLLSDVPALNENIISKLQSLCQDPDRSLLGVRALKFLIMFKPPIKEACLDLVAKLKDQNIDGMDAILKRYRPEALA